MAEHGSLSAVMQFLLDLTSKPDSVKPDDMLDT
jgi:hypothetical protein